jgi:hypothetical protein
MTMTKIHAALIRAYRTVAQAALAAIGSTSLIESVDWLVASKIVALDRRTDWKIVASGSALAGIVSLLTSAATDLPEVDTNVDA